MDIRIKYNSTMTIVGPSGSGKTLFTVRLLKYGRTGKIFSEPLGKIHWLHGAEVELGSTHSELSKLSNITFYKGFKDGWMENAKRHDVIVIDDLMSEAKNEESLESLFTRAARHRGIFVIYLTQNLFTRNSRTRNLNSHYLVVFKNPRDSMTIDYLARQMQPKARKFLMDAFDDATRNKPHGYLFFDFTQQCPDHVRIRTDILDQHIVYKQVETN